MKTCGDDTDRRRQCTKPFPLKENVNRKNQSSSLIFLRFISFRQQNLKCTFTFSYIFGCELIAGQ